MIRNHNFYLNLAFQLAEKNLGHTKLNPSVGCVIVKNDTVISSGVTSMSGRPHSEYNDLKKKLNKLQEESSKKQKLQDQFNQDIDELGRETESLVEEIEKWQT